MHALLSIARPTGYGVITVALTLRFLSMSDSAASL